MARLLRFFMQPDDELWLLQKCQNLKLEVYPTRIGPDWKTFPATGENYSLLPAEALYLAASELAPILTDKVKRGPDKGLLMIDDVNSPVIYWERSILDDEVLLSGRLWSEPDVLPHTGLRESWPERFRALVNDLEESIKKHFRPGMPKGFYIGPHAARRHKDGLRLVDKEGKAGDVKLRKG